MAANENTPIGFIGIGLMGLPLCKRLLAQSLPLIVWNRNREKTLPLTARGAISASSPADVASKAKVLMLCVTDDAAVEQICLGENGIFSAAAQGLIIVDHSSISPKLTRRLNAMANALGITWIDAPVSGGVSGAEAGQLVIMAGGDRLVLDRVSPILRHYAKRITHMGASGGGQVSKLCNQLVVAANSLLIAETVALAEHAGVDASQLAPALAGGFADSLPFQLLVPRMAARTFDPVQWRVATLIKDLQNATQLAQSNELYTPVALAALKQLQHHAQQGHDNSDLSSIILLHDTSPPEGLAAKDEDAT
ncbi:MAG: NAD(P)-dependent oxidoreductase [Moraxellaceae bacterium]|nr:NAD(P)-dependent oxidoreductase [Moraxellaceae bacterium]